MMMKKMLRLIPLKFYLLTLLLSFSFTTNVEAFFWWGFSSKPSCTASINPSVIENGGKPKLTFTPDGKGKEIEEQTFTCTDPSGNKSSGDLGTSGVAIINQEMPEATVVGKTKCKAMVKTSEGYGYCDASITVCGTDQKVGSDGKSCVDKTPSCKSGEKLFLGKCIKVATPLCDIKYTTKSPVVSKPIEYTFLLSGAKDGKAKNLKCINGTTGSELNQPFAVGTGGYSFTPTEVGYTNCKVTCEGRYGTQRSCERSFLVCREDQKASADGKSCVDKTPAPKCEVFFNGHTGSDVASVRKGESVEFRLNATPEQDPDSIRFSCGEANKSVGKLGKNGSFTFIPEGLGTTDCKVFLKGNNSSVPSCHAMFKVYDPNPSKGSACRIEAVDNTPVCPGATRKIKWSSTLQTLSWNSTVPIIGQVNPLGPNGSGFVVIPENLEIRFDEAKGFSPAPFCTKHFTKASNCGTPEPSCSLKFDKTEVMVGDKNNFTFTSSQNDESVKKTVTCKKSNGTTVFTGKLGANGRLPEAWSVLKKDFGLGKVTCTVDMEGKANACHDSFTVVEKIKDGCRISIDDQGEFCPGDPANISWVIQGKYAEKREWKNNFTSFNGGPITVTQSGSASISVPTDGKLKLTSIIGANEFSPTYPIQECKAQLDINANCGTNTASSISIAKVDANSADSDKVIGANKTNIEFDNRTKTNFDSTDSQTIKKGGDAIFKIIVKNTGDTALKNVVLTDSFSNNCSRNAQDTVVLHKDGDTTNFDAKEEIVYTCKQSSVQKGYVNEIMVKADVVGSNDTVNSADRSKVILESQKKSSISIAKVDANTADLDQVVGANENNIEFDNGTKTSFDSTDSQTIKKGGDAIFKIIVKNTGDTNLTSLEITDQRVDACGRMINFANLGNTVTHTKGAGNTGTNIFEPSDTVSYECKDLGVATAYTNKVFATGYGVNNIKTTEVSDASAVKFGAIGTKPSISIVKQSANTADLDGNKADDPINNDTQTIVSGEDAVFKITVENNGDTDILATLKIEDTYSSSCGGAVMLGQGQSGVFPSTFHNLDTSKLNSDKLFEPGESFTYECTEVGVTNTTFPDGYNEISVSGTANTIPFTTVKDDDKSDVSVASIKVEKTDANSLAVDLDGTVENDTQTINSGANPVFKITVTNTGTADLTSLAIEDPLSFSCARTIDFANLENTVTHNNGTGNSVTGPFEPNDTVSYKCSGAPTTANFTNTVYVEGKIGNEIATARVSDPSDIIVSVVKEPAISIKKTDHKTKTTDLDGILGNDTQTITDGIAIFRVTVVNTGDEALQNIVLTDPESPNCAGTVDFSDEATIPGTDKVRNDANSDGVFDKNDSFSYTCSINNVTDTTFVDDDNDISVSADPVSGGNSVNAEDASAVLIPTATSVVEATKIASPVSGAAVKIDDTITYTLTVRNIGNTDLTDMMLTDVLNAGLTFVPTPANQNVTATGQTITVNIPTLAVSETKAIDIRVRVNATATAGTDICNIFTVKGLSTIVTPSNKVCHRVNPILVDPSFSIVKSSSIPVGTSIQVGSQFDYTVTVTNDDTQRTLDSVILTDNLNPNLEFVLGDAGITATGQVLTFTIPSVLAPTESVSLNFTVRVRPGTPNDLQICNIISGQAVFGNQTVQSESGNICRNTPTTPGGGGGGGGGGGAPSVPTIGTCAVRGDNTATCSGRKPYRNGAGWSDYQACLSGGTSAKDCVYAWAQQQGLALCGDSIGGSIDPFSNNNHDASNCGAAILPALEPSWINDLEPVTSTRACDGCFKATETKITKEVLNKDGNVTTDLRIARGDEVDYRLTLDLGINSGYTITDIPLLRIYDYTIPAVGGNLSEMHGLDANWMEGSSDGKYIDLRDTLSVINKLNGTGKSRVELAYKLNSALASTADTASIDNVAFAVVEYEYMKTACAMTDPDCNVVHTQRDFIADNPARARAALDAWKNKASFSSLGATATVKIVRPFVQATNGGNLGFQDTSNRVSGHGNDGDRLTTGNVFADNSSELFDFNDVDTLDPLKSFQSADTDNFYESLQFNLESINSVAGLTGTFEKVADQEIYFVSGDLTLGGEIKLDNKSKTFIIDGNLVINSEVTLTDGFAAFIVRNDKDIIIENDVEHMEGLYIAETGQVKNDVTDASYKQLTISGALMGDLAPLLEKRWYIGTGTNLEPNVKVDFDLRLLEETPPALEQFLGTEWKESIE